MDEKKLLYLVAAALAVGAIATRDPVLLVCAASLVLIVLFLNYRESRQQEEMAELRMARCRDRVNSLVTSITATFETAQQHFRTATHLLDAAEIDFADRAFAPFWDSIESAILSVGLLDESIRSTNEHFKEYLALVAEYGEKTPMIVMADEWRNTLTGAPDASARVRQLVRVAHRDFEFASIFEQRKTHRLLVEGFAGLDDAVAVMTDRLEASVSSLNSSIIHLQDDIHDSLDSIHQEIRGVRDDISRSDSASAVRARKTQSLLGSIRRRL